MINLFNRTEYSFRNAYGRLEDVLATNQGDAAGICDRHGTWGHVQWKKACEKAAIRPIYGVELAVVNDMDLRDKDDRGVTWVKFIALNSNGLKELYELVTLATEKFYYHPRIDWSVIDQVSYDIIVAAPAHCHSRLEQKSNFILYINPSSSSIDIKHASEEGWNMVAGSDNYYPTPADHQAYQMVCGRNASSMSTVQHIITPFELEYELEEVDSDILLNAVDYSKFLSDQCFADLPSATMVKPVITKTLLTMCTDAAEDRGIDLTDQVYADRLARELNLIEEKDFKDYFYVVADLVRYAKENMLVGPARGSSCGSLVCYLLSITEIDPIPYGLLFERFIDINRADLPDIDIDFPDDRREMVFDYLRGKYGADCVARLGTVSRFKPKSTITDVSKALRIPQWEMKDLKDSIIERSGGDARTSFCIMDTFEELAQGRKALEKYPELAVAAEIEGHARHTGQHAAGILVTNEPVHHYCSVDEQTGAAQIDKYDAEELNLLKIDALGLRTLSVIQDTLDQIQWSREKLIQYRKDDKRAFDLINSGNFAGIFQFEGYALQSLTRQIDVSKFEDMVAITALARPGPLNSGGANQWIQRHAGNAKIEYLHPLMKKATEITYGIIVYQEQVMSIVRELGNFSWEETSIIRKGMSKSMGEEYLNQKLDSFVKGAKENGIDEALAQEIWSNINTMGSWAFNRSHAVAYGLISYWCAVLKARFPLEFAAACLRHSKDDDQPVKILRELHEIGFEYEVFNKEKSVTNWSVHNGKLIGGLIGVKGIGEKMAADIMLRRKEGRELTKRHHNLMNDPITPYDTIFECNDLWGHIFESPDEYGISSRLTKLNEITDKTDKTVVVIAKIATKTLRDENELLTIEKRGGTKMQGQTLYLNLRLEDDTEPILAKINRFNYNKIGKPIVDEALDGQWFVFKGRVRKGFRMIHIKRWKLLTGNSDFEDKQLK